MPSERRRDEPLSRDEERDVSLLSSLREEAPSADPHLTAAVLRTARWQITARRLLSIVDGLVAGAATTVGGASRAARNRRSRRRRTRRAFSGSRRDRARGVAAPKLFIALVLVLAGVIASQYARAWVDRLTDQMALGTALGRIVQLVVAAVFMVTALSALGVPTDVLMMVVTVSLVAVAGALALAFGLGSRDLARQMTAGRYVATTFAVGQRIGVAELTGEIVALEGASAVLRTDDGRTIRVPNHLLLESIVTVEDSPPPRMV